MKHPLLGSDWKTLRTVLRELGPIEKGQGGLAWKASASALFRGPFTAAEKVWLKMTESRQPPLTPPVFIVGHWRSGTTHLYNILSKSPVFGYVSPLATGLPWNFLLLGRLLGPLLNKALPKDRVIDRIPVRPDSPQEDEIALANMTPLSFFHGLFFPQHYQKVFDRSVFFDGCKQEEIDAWSETFLTFLKKVSRQQRNRPLLIKNPVYTARVSHLRKLFPAAQFIHIHRHPYEVFRSTRSFYRKLFPAMALQPYDHIDIEEIVVRNYSRMMERVVSESADLPPDQFVEIGYDELDQSPLEAVERIYDQLGWPGWIEARPLFETYLGSVRSYQKNRHEVLDDADDKIYRACQPFFERWEYSRTS